MFKKTAYILASLLGILCFHTSFAQASEMVCKSGSAICDITFEQVPAILNMPCGAGEQHVYYTIKNNSPVSVRVKKDLEVIAGNTSNSTVVFGHGGTCGNSSSVILDSGKSCTIEVIITSQACALSKADQKTALPRVNHALVLTTNTRQEPLRKNITLDITSTNSQRAYIANSNANQEISICHVNQNGSVLTGCAQYSDPSFNYPIDIVLNNGNTKAYVANSGNNTVSVCHVDPSTGLLGDCDVFTHAGLLEFAGLKLNAHNTQLYVTNLHSDAISICPVDADGGLTKACTSAPVGNGPNGRIVLNLTETKSYIADFNANQMSICNGKLRLCTMHSDATFDGLQGMGINLSGSHVYIANTTNDTVSVCNASDISEPCTASTGSATFNFGLLSTNMYMNNFNRYGYIPNNGNNTVSVCKVSPSTGAIGVCVVGGGTFVNPTSVWIATLDI